MFVERVGATQQHYYEGRLRERVYKFAIALSIVFLADGLFMAWALYAKPWLLGYAHVSLLPLFIPATLVALTIIGIYVHGFARQSWRPRKLDLVFFVMFALAWAAKLAFFVDWNSFGR